MERVGALVPALVAKLARSAAPTMTTSICLISIVFRLSLSNLRPILHHHLPPPPPKHGDIPRVPVNQPVNSYCYYDESPLSNYLTIKVHAYDDNAVVNLPDQ